MEAVQDLSECVIQKRSEGKRRGLWLQDKSCLRVGLGEGPEDWDSRSQGVAENRIFLDSRVLQALEHDITSFIYLSIFHMPSSIILLLFLFTMHLGIKEGYLGLASVECWNLQRRLCDARVCQIWKVTDATRNALHPGNFLCFIFGYLLFWPLLWTVNSFPHLSLCYHN